MYKPEQYTYRVAWSDEDQVFVAGVAEFSLEAAHGDTPEEALQEARIVVEASLELLEEHGDPIPQPMGLTEFSGRVLLRMPTSLHKELTTEAKEEGISLNQLINLKLGVSLAKRLQA